MTSYPKVLFITTCSFNKISGGGITFSNLFNGWPIENIATVHCDDNVSSNNICNTYYKLTSREIHYLGFRKTSRSNFSNSTSNSSNLFFNKRSNFIRKFKFFLFGNNFPNSGHLSSDIIEFIDNFKPDVIYTILGFSAIIDLVDKISVKYDIPVITHIMDDWISSNYTSGLFGFIERNRVSNRFNKAIAKSSKAIVISESMKKEYESRYDRNFIVIHNAIDVKRINITHRKFIQNECGVFKIIYTGSIYPYAQLDSLVLFCNAIIELNNQGFNIEFIIYSPSSMTSQLERDFMCYNFINFLEPIQDDDIYFKTLALADILLLPSNFDSASLKFIGLSMPTKVPSYLVSGTPILVIGNIGSAQVEYALSVGWGLVVTIPDITIIGKNILELLTNENLRKKLILRARDVAFQFHNIEVVRSEFQNLFSNPNE